ncbi:hypothetical protein O6H91_04G054800 [Diphasiastrum complanatum]|uniref:Uncharacterized protein n=1 Tax=Diphasiastrum complanatum TaxID=34168 RepID=A0ACC2DWS8_DIPCM|nr:hypothetical protein O6H91_04G054800 [Diphasiastrum complanatum]
MKLQVQVMEARGLASRDSNGFSDPYVRLQLGRTKTKTKVVQKSLNPSWYEEFLFKLEDLKSELLISVWDEDSFTDDFLGQIKLPVAQVLNSDKQALLPIWYPLQKRNCKSKVPVSGEILLGLSLYGRTYNVIESSSSPDTSLASDLPTNVSLSRETSAESPSLTETAHSSLSGSFTDSSRKSSDKEDTALEKQKLQHKTFGQKLSSFFGKKPRELNTEHDQSSLHVLLSEEKESIEEDDSSVPLSFFTDDEKITGASEEDFPPPLQGGVLLDQSYAVGFRALNAILLKPGSAFPQELMKIQGTTNFVEEPWKKVENGFLKRTVSYTKAPSKLVKAVKATEEQIYTRADDKGFVVNISVSTPDVPYGSNFRTELQICIAAGPNLPSGEKTSQLCISWQMNFLHSTMIKGLIENGARQGLKESFQQYAQLLETYTNAIPDAPSSFPSEQQETVKSEWDLAVDYFSNPAVILALFSLSVVVIHIYISRVTSWVGLEYLGLDLPDSFGELLTSSLITLQVEHIVKLAFRSLQTRVCIAGDHGVKAKGEGWLLTVTLLEGDSLQPLENSRSADPYVMFTCNGKTRTSSVKLQTPNPQWKVLQRSSSLMLRMIHHLQWM